MTPTIETRKRERIARRYVRAGGEVRQPTMSDLSISYPVYYKKKKQEARKARKFKDARIDQPTAPKEKPERTAKPRERSSTGITTVTVGVDEPGNANE
jgi:hypothetical protein